MWTVQVPSRLSRSKAFTVQVLDCMSTSPASAKHSMSHKQERCIVPPGWHRYRLLPARDLHTDRHVCPGNALRLEDSAPLLCQARSPPQRLLNGTHHPRGQHQLHLLWYAGTGSRDEGHLGGGAPHRCSADGATGHHGWFLGGCPGAMTGCLAGAACGTGVADDASQ